MGSAFKIFFHAEGSKPFLVLMALVLASALEIIGIGALLPLFSTTIEGEQSRLAQIALGALSTVGLESGNRELIVFLVILFIAKYGLSYLALNITSFAEIDVSARLRTKLLTLLFSANWRFLVRRKAGQLTNEIVNNTSRAVVAYRQSARLFSYSIQAFFYLAAAVLVSLGLTIIGIVVGFGFYLCFGFLVKRTRILGKRQTESFSALSTSLSDTLTNIKPIVAMERQAHIEAHIQEQNRQIRASGRRISILGNTVYTISDAFLVGTLLIGIYIANVWLEIPFSELAIMGILSIRAIETLKQSQRCLQQVAGAEAAYWSAQKQVEQLEAMQEKRSGHKVPRIERDCTFEAVSFGFDGTLIIKNANFKVAANEITVLIGPSGAGKSTLIDLLLGLYQPDAGRVLFDDIPLTEINLGRLRQMIGYVPQETTLLHGTLRENITLGDPDITDAQIRKALHLAGADTFVDGLPHGLETNAGEMGTRFSGGERQRLALARALVTEPKMLLLDEVTSALDPETEMAICANIKDLSGMLTILAVTHRPAWTSIADSILRVENGLVEPATASAFTATETKEPIGL
ncbi:MAG: ABC transporter ATP-binding protein [Cognatishimia sp.]|uniref:ABC transporter ATP-binding protein n=1 Tax=Cognatishimia sp. TaxID=2211648 RepID=UPI003B8BF6BB